MIQLDFEAPDLSKFKLNLNLEEILDEASAFLVSRILTRFLAETDPNGKPWVPSKAGMTRRLAGGTGTLFDTGRLFRSIQVYKDRDGQRRIATDVPYGPLLQSGGGPFNMPARVFMGFSKEDESMVRQIVQLRVNEAISIST